MIQKALVFGVALALVANTFAAVVDFEGSSNDPADYGVTAFDPYNPPNMAIISAPVDGDVISGVKSLSVRYPSYRPALISKAAIDPGSALDNETVVVISVDIRAKGTNALFGLTPNLNHALIGVDMAPWTGKGWPYVYGCDVMNVDPGFRWVADSSVRHFKFSINFTTHKYTFSTYPLDNVSDVVVIPDIAFPASGNPSLPTFADLQAIFLCDSIFDNIKTLGSVVEMSGVVQPQGCPPALLGDVGVRIELIQGGIVKNTFRTMVDSTGRFTVSVPPDTYDVGIKTYAHLRTILRSRDVSADPTDLGSITLTAGDIDNDNVVTSNDLALVLAGLDTAGDNP